MAQAGDAGTLWLPVLEDREGEQMREIGIFSGGAHPQLAEEVCAQLGLPLHPANISRFSNDCLQVQLNANCRESDIFLIQPLVPPVQEHLMELLLMLDAARGASAARITAVMPHYAYARSDKKDAPRISIGGRLVADLLATAGASRVLTMTLHAPQVHGFFGIPVDHLNALGVLAQHFRDRDLSNSVVVSPDLGNAKSATQFARLLGVPVAAGSKQRLSDDRVIIDAIVGEVQGKDVIVMDDEIANGGTIVEVLHQLRQRHVEQITVCSPARPSRVSASSQISPKSSLRTPCPSPPTSICPTSTCSPSRHSWPKPSAASTTVNP